MTRKLPQEYENFANQTPSGDFFTRPMPRRGFLRRMAEVAMIGAVADTYTGELLWAGTNPTIHILDNPAAKRQFPTTFTLAMGGFNVADVKGLGKAVETILPGYGQMAYLQNSTHGLNLADIIRTALQFIKDNDVTRLRLYGHSMGGMLAAQLGAALKDKVALEALILDCSPANVDDVCGGEQKGSTWLLHATDEISLHLGPVARFLSEAAAPIAGGRRDFFHVCRDALGKVSSGEICSNRLVQSQASLIRTFDASDYTDVFGAETHVIRLRPEEYSADGVVNNETALPKWQNGLAHEVIDVPVKGSGHANPGQCSEQYAVSLLAAARQCNFYRGTQYRPLRGPL